MGNVQRRPRGSLNSGAYTQTNYTISKENKLTLETFAQSIGVTAAEGLDRLLTQFTSELQASADGLPAWIDRAQLPEELPIRKAS